MNVNDNRQNEQALLLRLKKGDHDAFGDLYDAYAAALFGVVSKIVRSEDEGQDVLQDAFVKIWKNIHYFDENKGTFFTWMLNIARNSAIDRYRRLKKEGKVEIQEVDSNVDIARGHQTTIKTSTIGLADLVDKLPEEQRLMVEYIYFNGYTQQEVADELNMPLGTVKTRVRTAVQSLRKVFTLLLFWI